MIDVIGICAMVAVVAMGVYGVRYYWNIGNDPQTRTTMGTEPANAFETVLRGDFAAQTPELEKPLAVQKAFGIIILVPIVLIIMISSLLKMHGH